MNDLPPAAVQMLYPVLTILGVVIVSLAALVTGLWTGFKWLRGQITETAQGLVTPLAERIAKVEAAVDKAHQRIDEWIGARQ